MKNVRMCMDDKIPIAWCNPEVIDFNKIRKELYSLGILCELFKRREIIIDQAKRSCFSIFVF